MKPWCGGSKGDNLNWKRNDINRYNGNKNGENKLAQQMHEMVLKLTVLYSITFIHSILVVCLMFIIFAINVFWINQRQATMIFFL